MKHQIFQTPQFISPINFILLIIAGFLFLFSGCKKEEIQKYTLNKNIYFEITIDGKTYSNYGYWEYQQQPTTPETPLMVSSEIKDSSGAYYTTVNIWALDVLLRSDYATSQNSFLGQIQTHLAFIKPGRGLTGTYRQLYFDPHIGFGAMQYVTIIPAGLSWMMPTNDVEFTISDEGQSSTEGAFAVGEYTINLAPISNPNSIAIANGKFRAYLK
jgi:hypothetical protein